MNNKPIAWITEKASAVLEIPEFSKATNVLAVKPTKDDKFNVPLYTHPINYCPSENNEAYEKGFIDGMAKQMESRVQQMVEGYAKLRELTDEEITELANKHIDWVCYDEGEYGMETELVGIVDFAKAILRKAQEK